MGLPIGLWLGHTGRGSFVAVTVANVGRAVPSIGLVLLFFAVLGAGFMNIMLALVLLAIPPILTNAYAGVRQVDADVVDAARGIGMTGAEIVRRVELPLALPLVSAGIRTSTVNVIATATLGPEGGVVTLGDPIINPTAYGGAGRLGAARSSPSSRWRRRSALGAVERAVTPKGTQTRRPGRGACSSPDCRQPRGGHNRHDHPTRTIPAGVPAPPGSARAAAARRDRCCGLRQRRQQRQLVELVVLVVDRRRRRSSRPTAPNGKTTLTVGSKNFTEQFILGEIYAQALEAAGYKVTQAAQPRLGADRLRR